MVNEQALESGGGFTPPVQVFDLALRRLPRIEDMNKGFSENFPFYIAPWEKGAGKRLLQALSHRPETKDITPLKLDSPKGKAQETGSDCVGAGIMSVFSEITGTPTTGELYGAFLKSALERRMAQQEKEGVKVEPSAFNLFMTPEFRQRFPDSEVTVADRQHLSLEELAEIVRITRGKRKPSYKLFVFPTFSSLSNPAGGHLVNLREIGSAETKVYDPKVGEEAVLTNTEFNRRWEHGTQGAIFVFVKSSI